MVKCSEFIPSKDWRIACEQFLVNCLYEGLDSVAPYMGKIDSLKSKVRDLEALADRAREATEQYARWNDMIEVLSRMKANKLTPLTNP